MSQRVKESLDKSFVIAQKHLHRLQYAYTKIAPLFPLDAEKYTQLSDEEIAYIDQYLFRFAKLQDVMGQKIFRYLLLYVGEDVDYKPFMDILNRMEKLELLEDAKQWIKLLMDILNRMEKLELLEDAKQWIKLREIRNEISHQYDDDPEEMSVAINHIVGEKETIERVFQKLLSYYNGLSNA